MPPDAVVLVPVQSGQLMDVKVPEARVTFLGRGKSTGIADASISRQHCELFWKGEPVLKVTPHKKRCVIERCDCDVLVQVGETAEVRACPAVDCVHTVKPVQVY